MQLLKFNWDLKTKEQSFKEIIRFKEIIWFPTATLQAVGIHKCKMFCGIKEFMISRNLTKLASLTEEKKGMGWNEGWEIHRCQAVLGPVGHRINLQSCSMNMSKRWLLNVFLYLFLFKKTNYITWLLYFKVHCDIWSTEGIIAGPEEGKPIKKQEFVIK